MRSEIANRIMRFLLIVFAFCGEMTSEKDSGNFTCELPRLTNLSTATTKDTN